MNGFRSTFRSGMRGALSAMAVALAVAASGTAVALVGVGSASTSSGVTEYGTDTSSTTVTALEHPTGGEDRLIAKVLPRTLKTCAVIATASGADPLDRLVCTTSEHLIPSTWWEPVGNQGSMAACQAFIITTAAGMLANKLKLKDEDEHFAPMFMYSAAGKATLDVRTGQWVYDRRSGMPLQYALWFSEDIGLATTQRFPSQVPLPGQGEEMRSMWGKVKRDGWRITGSLTLFTTPENAELTTVQRDEGIRAIKRELLQDRPVLVSVYVPDSFDRYHPTSPTDVYEMGDGESFHMATSIDDPTRKVRSSHGLVVIGFTAKGLLVQNSWGTGWGAQGRATIGWATAAKILNGASVIKGVEQKPR